MIDIKDVKIIVEKPPMWNEIVAAFNVVPVNAIFSYGDCIYNPQGKELQDYLIKHEMAHFKQQGGTREGAAIWWGKFLRDPQFRVEQEIECYGVQLHEMYKLTNDRNKRVKILWDLAASLSGPLYNNCISHSEASKRIKEAEEKVCRCVCHGNKKRFYGHSGACCDDMNGYIDKFE